MLGVREENKENTMNDCQLKYFANNMVCVKRVLAVVTEMSVKNLGLAGS